MTTEMTVIEAESLLEKVNQPVFALREGLVAKGYTEDEADAALAGALPNCVAKAVLKRGGAVI